MVDSNYIPDLGAVLGEIPWAIIDGQAVAEYVPKTIGIGLHILVPVHLETDARNAFLRHGYRAFDGPEHLTFATQFENELLIIVQLTGAPWLLDALERPHVRGHLHFLPKIELTVLKLFAGKLTDYENARSLLTVMDDQERRKTRELVQEWGKHRLGVLAGLVLSTRRQP